MARLLTAFTLLLICGNVLVASAQTGAESSPADLIIHGPTFRYVLKEDENPLVCKHMLRVFNDRFAHPWDAPPLPWSKDQHWYSADSKYTFPLLPGIKHSTEATFEMRFAASPTSPEFSAIHWKEGRAVPGGCPAGQTCPGEGPIPILVAYFDFDNDGVADTVIREAFNSGKYSPTDVIEVWSGQTLKITGTPSLWDLAHPQDKKLTPTSLSDEYLRPFIYRGVAYVADYQAEYRADSDPVREDMLINRYHFSGRKDSSGRPESSSDIVCDLRMRRLKN